jgi:hypothetical protein
VPEFREIFGAFLIEDARTIYGIASGAAAAAELIISGPRADLGEVGRLL